MGDRVGVGLAAAYGVMALAFMGAMATGRLPNTRTLRAFSVLVVLTCVFRAVYLTATLTYLTAARTDDDPAVWGRGWWLSTAHWVLFVLSAVFLNSHYVQMAKVWADGLSVLTSTDSARTVRALNRALFIYALWEAWVVISRAVVPITTSIINNIINTIA